MQQIADRLTEKIHTLTKLQLAEVERFVESLQAWERDSQVVRSAAPLSEPAFAAVWNNPEDEAYDAL
jgi:hypothetical protein